VSMNELYELRNVDGSQSRKQIQKSYVTD